MSPVHFYENQVCHLSIFKKIRFVICPFLRKVVYTCIHIYIHTCTNIYIHVHTYIHTYIHAYIHTYIHTYIHIYIHTYIHTYGQTAWILLDLPMNHNQVIILLALQLHLTIAMSEIWYNNVPLIIKTQPAAQSSLFKQLIPNTSRVDQRSASGEST